MNVNQHNDRRSNYVELYFDLPGVTKTVRVQFDNFEVKADILPQLKHYPTIFKSAGGVATALATRQPRRVVITFQTYYTNTILKLEQVSRYLAGKYSLTLKINGYYDKVWDVILDPGLGVSIGAPVPPGTIPNVSIPVLINGMGPVIMSPDHFASWRGFKGKDLVEVPFNMKAVIEHDPSWALPAQSRAVGARRNELITFTFHESATLTLPSAINIVIDPGDTGILGDLPD